MVKRNSEKNSGLSTFDSSIKASTSAADCVPPSDAFDTWFASDSAAAPAAQRALIEVGVEDLDDLFAAVITRLAACAVEPTQELHVVLACVQALQQLHLTAANELVRRLARINALERSLPKLPDGPH